MRDAMRLVKNHVPFDVAFSLNPTWRVALNIVCDEIDGAEFDWNAWKFRERSKP